LPWVPPAVTSWLQELPDEATGLDRLEQFALDAIRFGCHTPTESFARASANGTPPQFGETSLFGRKSTRWLTETCFRELSHLV